MRLRLKVPPADFPNRMEIIATQLHTPGVPSSVTVMKTHYGVRLKGHDEGIVMARIGTPTGWERI